MRSSLHTMVKLGMLLGLLLMLTACSQAGAVPADTPTPQPGDAGAAGPVLTWERVGGIAGFCDAVEIAADGRVVFMTCEDAVVDEGALSSERQAQLESWIDRYAPFEWEETDPATADAMTVRVTFQGVGDELASQAEQKAMADYAAAVYAAFAMDAGEEAVTPSPMAGVPPVPAEGRAYDAARDALMARLGQDLEVMELVSVTEEVWRDSCLGLSEPGEMCMTVLTPGYRVVVNVDGTPYVVRTNQDASVARVEGKAEGEPKRIGWEEAVALIRSGQVTQVFQTHALTVTLTLEDGSTVTTVEPAIDDVFDVVKTCGDPCADIILATE